ncbi:MAG: hypothetical protein ABIQ16_27725 [Polyangiaceae bacterium]
MEGAGKISLRFSDAPRADPQCEALFKLYDGALGTVELGRLLKGNDTGRLVTLRRLAGAPSPDLASATDLARSVAHPRLAKVLGHVSGRGDWYVASEYIAGVTLFELGEAVAKQRAPLDAGVAARIVLDALTAASEAQQLLAATANLHDVRCVFSDSIWIASYGEVFVSEVLIAPFLAASLDLDTALPSTLADLHSAGVELSRLLGLGALSGDEAPVVLGNLGPELGEILRHFRHGDGSYQTLDEPIAALKALGAGFLATEQRVSEELQRLLGLVMARRTQKVALLERGATQGSDDEQTRYFRVSAPPQRLDTTRPPEAAEAPDTDQKRARSDPAGELTAIVGSIAPYDEGQPTAAPPTPPDPHAIDDSSHPISAVWEQAREMLDSSAQRAKRQGRPLPDPARRRAPHRIKSKRPARPSGRSEEAARVASAGKENERAITLKVVLLIIGLLAVALLVRALWSSAGH